MHSNLFYVSHHHISTLAHQGSPITTSPALFLTLALPRCTYPSHIRSWPRPHTIPIPTLPVPTSQVATTSVPSTIVVHRRVVLVVIASIVVHADGAVVVPGRIAVVVLVVVERLRVCVCCWVVCDCGWMVGGWVGVLVGVWCVGVGVVCVVCTTPASARKRILTYVHGQTRHAHACT